MPIIFLSPSTQENNLYVTGTGSEEYWMNRLADEMIPYLRSCGIRYTRNTPEMTAGSSIRLANEGWYDFYLALHSNAAAPENYGNVRGIIAFYYPTSTQGQRAAQIFVNNLRTVYPLPDKVVTRSTTSLGEVRDSKFPAGLLELGYHDNGEDAQARENMLRAAYCAGIAFTQSYVGYVHGVAHSLGGRYGIPHGLANAVILPYFLDEYGASCEKRLGRLARVCGIAPQSADDHEASRTFIDWVRTMNRSMEIPDKIDGIKEEDILKMADHADKESNPLYPVPRLMDKKELARMYRVIAGWKKPSGKNSGRE